MKLDEKTKMSRGYVVRIYEEKDGSEMRLISKKKDSGMNHIPEGKRKKFGAR